MSSERIFWTQFLELYKKSPALWRIKSYEYSNRGLKAKAYEKLIYKLQEKYPEANREMVVKKINTFRTTYRRELKKVKTSDDVYEPKLWFYDILSFLEDQEDSVPNTFTIEYETQEEASPKTSPTPHGARKRKFIEEDKLTKTECKRLQALRNTTYTISETIFWTEFLELYKKSPALWRIKSYEYSNRAMKAKAYEKLVYKLKEKYPEANRDTVVKKINAFRTTYRRELKKVKASDDVYEPTLWFYHILSFLEDQEDSVPNTCTIKYETQEETSPKTSATPHRLRKKKITEEDKLIKIACEHLQAQPNTDTINNDPDDAVAKAWGVQLKEMNADQKVLARKLISDILFEGCTGNLRKFHVQQFLNFLESKLSTTVEISVEEQEDGIDEDYDMDPLV